MDVHIFEEDRVMAEKVGGFSKSLSDYFYLYSLPPLAGIDYREKCLHYTWTEIALA